MLGLAVAIATLVPNLANGDDQAIARFIMSKLQVEQQRGSLKGFHVDMRVDQGTVWYKGFVSNPDQKNLILRTAQRAKHLGVVQIVDDINVQQAQMEQPIVAQPVTQPAIAPTMAPVAQQAGYVQDDIAVPAQPQMNIPSPSMPRAMNTSIPTNAIPANTNPMPYARTQGNGNPMPMAMSASMAHPVQGDSASMPGYAWPSYASHPNYAAVTYPQQYSPTAWPYIGPFYPYPQVPLGWRKVTLEWDDGWWWLDFHNR